MKHKILLRAFLGGNPEDAAEILRDFAPNPTFDDIGASAPSMEEYRHAVGLLIRGTKVFVFVEDQKALNALTGHFWVEPRRLPVEP